MRTWSVSEEYLKSLRKGTWMCLLVPLVRSARSRRVDRLALAAILSVVGFQAIEAKVVSTSEAASKGLQYLEEKQYQEAIPYLERASRLEPDQVGLVERLAYAYSMTGRHQDAITGLEDRARRLGDLSSWGWELLSHACRQTGQWSRLLDIADAAIVHSPRSAQAYHMAGLAASQIHGLRSAEARTYYAKYVELNPDPAETAFVKELFPDLTIVPHAASLHGSWTDDTGEVSEPYIDLYIGSLYAEHQMEELELGINVAGLHPEDQQVHTQFEMLFDTDNDVATGSTVGLFSGIDKILIIELAGTFPFSETYGTAHSRLSDVASGKETALPAARVAHVHKIIDAIPPEKSRSFPVWDSIDQTVPLELLEIQADQVPIGIRAINLDTGATDLAAFVFAYNPWYSPYVKINPSTAAPGAQIEFTGRRFTPHSTVRLTIGRVEILQEQADAKGHFVTVAPLPHVLTGDHLFRGVDSKGTFHLTVYRVHALEGN